MAALTESMGMDEALEALRLCNSYNRLPSLIAISYQMEPDEWLTLLGEEWSVCDNIGRCADDLLDATPFGWLGDDPPLRRFLMNETERVALAALPDEVALFRGCYASNKWGLSWSLDRATAARFPTLHRYRQQGQPLLVRARIAKGDIWALKLCRDEAEIIAVRPKHVSTSHIRVA